MFVNLRTIPAGQAMYTVAVTDDPRDTPTVDVCYEELDVVGSSRLTSKEVAQLAEPRVMDFYGPGARVIGVVNQTDAYVMFQDSERDLRQEV